MKFALVVNLSKERAIKYAKKISLFLLDKNAEIAMIEDCSQYFKGIHIHYSKNITELFEYCDMAITVGGDGTIIHAAKYAAKADKQLIGVNVGRLGFAADVEPHEYEQLERLITGDYTTEERILLDVEVIKEDGSKHYLAVNDAVVARGQLSKTIDLHLTLDGDEISKYRADGLLFSTPTGSTAYSLSAGGPILAPKMECTRDNDIVVTPIKGKQLTNIRASGTDEAIRLVPPIQLTLESAVEFINDDELAEITPKSIRIRKRWLKEFERRRAARGDSRVGPGI